MEFLRAFLPPWLSPTLLGAIAIALAAGGISGWAVHRIDDGRYQALVAAQAVSEASAVKLARADEISRSKLTYDRDIAATKAQTTIVTHTETVIRKVPVYVTQKADATCHLTVGFLRAVNSAYFGTDIPESPSVANDADAEISLSDATAILAANGGRCRLSRDQASQWRGWATDQLSRNPP